jgi:hypothetical protein
MMCCLLGYYDAALQAGEAEQGFKAAGEWRSAANAADRKILAAATLPGLAALERQPKRRDQRRGAPALERWAWSYGARYRAGRGQTPEYQIAGLEYYADPHARRSPWKYLIREHWFGEVVYWCQERPAARQRSDDRQRSGVGSLAKDGA